MDFFEISQSGIMQQYSTEAEWRDMIQIEFSEEEIQQLNYERYHHPHPRVQKKMEVLYLKSRGLSHQEIRRLCQISKTTLALFCHSRQLTDSKYQKNRM